MGRGRVPTSTSIDAQKLHRLFDEKIAGVSNSTADSLPIVVCAARLRHLDVPRLHRRRRYRRHPQATLQAMRH